MEIWTDLKINYEKQPPKHVTLASPSGRYKERAEDSKDMPSLKQGRSPMTVFLPVNCSNQAHYTRDNKTVSKTATDLPKLINEN